MEKNRLEAFSDGVIAIIITIMVLEIKVPQQEESGFNALIPRFPKFLSYILSFIYVGIYWNNHHHLFQSSSKVDGRVLWANLHFLFWLSLFPFVTAWAGENHFQKAPMALYGTILLMAAISWVILLRTLLKANDAHSILAKAVKGNSFKEKISPVIYIMGICVSFYQPFISVILYTITAFLWLIPDKRMESTIMKEKK